ncbi:MAG: transcriptional repressor [Bryobacterales bacterium]|nr:transcriptional repressor [Bryobacterales bacterium]
MSLRNTRQKAAIRDAFELANRPLSTGEVLAFAQDRIRGIGLSTVYRNIRWLLDDGWLNVVELPGELRRYEIAGKNHHHHFRCESCGRVLELRGCVPALDKLAGPGFMVRRHELVLYGLCPSCRK